MRLLIVDDHPLFLEGFAAMVARLRPRWRLETAATGDAAVAQVTAARPDLLVLDVSLPDRDGFDLAHCLKQRFANLPIVLMSGRNHAAMAVRAKASPADGFVAKTTPQGEFVDLLEATIAGRGAWPCAHPHADIPHLTPRQAQVLDLLAAGHGNKEIRHRLGIAERTVRAHLTELFQLLDVHGRMPALIKARTLGLID